MNFLNSEELKEYDLHSSCVIFDTGELVYKQDAPITHLAYLKKGLVKIVRQEHRHNFIVKIVCPRDFLDFPSILSETRYPSSAFTISPSEICFIEKAHFIQLIEQNGIFAKDFLHISYQGYTASFNRILGLIHKQLPGRLADVLLFFKHYVYNSDVFTLPLSRGELADYIGVSKKSFIRTLTEFKNDRIIKTNGKTIEIIEPLLLERLSKLG